MEETIASEPFVGLDYAAVAEPVTFRPVESAFPPVRLLVGVAFGGTPLMDNTLLAEHTRDV